MTAKNYLSILKIRKDERHIALGALILIGVLNLLLVLSYFYSFTPLTENYHRLFVRGFHLSGFDPLTYSVISDWSQEYNIFRHPLLAFMMYPFYLLNQALMWITGINCTIFIVAIIQTTMGTYGAVMLYRIMREVIEIGRYPATALTAMFYGFGFIILSVIAPDHFGPSMALLLTALYISGKLIKSGRIMNIKQTVLLFILTAGISLNNGIKIFLSAFFTNGKKFFRIKYLLLAVILPAGLIWQGAHWTYDYYIAADWYARNKVKMERAAEQKRVRDSLEIVAKTDATVARNLALQDSISKANAAKVRTTTGKPISNGMFSQWTDISTPRTESIIENFFGEGIQLHQDHLLEDQLVNRPVIVEYRQWWKYAIEGIIVMMFILGIWCGRKSRFMWMVMSYFMFDVLIHVVLGFGLNEVYIMSAHYLFAIPIMIAFLFRSPSPDLIPRGGKKNDIESLRRLWVNRLLQIIITLLALWLWGYNGYLIVSGLI